jgi:hypothetical protein
MDGVIRMESGERGSGEGGMGERSGAVSTDCPPARPPACMHGRMRVSVPSALIVRKTDGRD